MSGQGHNVDAGGKLRSFIERVERVEEEIKGLNGDKSEIYKEARGEGYDVKVMRKVVAARKMDSAEREEQGALFDMYWNAIHGVAEEAPRVHVHEANQIFPSADRVSPPVRNRTTGIGSANTGGSHVTADEPPTQTEKAPDEGQTSLAAREGEQVAAPNHQPTAIKPPPSDEDLEIPEFLRRSDGYARAT